ncbi:hypothetical protein [Amedibacillus sp. YH-ame10]
MISVSSVQEYHTRANMQFCHQAMKTRALICIISILCVCTACGKPSEVKAEMGKQTECPSSLKGNVRYFKMEEFSDASCHIINEDYKQTGVLLDNKFAITNNVSDIFVNNKTASAIATQHSSISYGSHTIEIKYYLYDDILIDTSKEIIEKQISGLSATYYLKMGHDYINGTVSLYDLDSRYENFSDIPEENLNSIHLEIKKALDAYTNLNTTKY